MFRKFANRQCNTANVPTSILPSMNRPKLSRALRITWTAFWGIACVLLCVLWVRSYWLGDGLQIISPPLHRHLILDSTRGRIGLFAGDRLSQFWLVRWESQPITPEFIAEWRKDPPKNLGFDIVTLGMHGIFMPVWFPVLVFAAFGILPWLSWRFSLRTLLVATTVVATVLGFGLWVMR